MGPAKKARVTGKKDYCPLSELTEARGGQGLPGHPPPLIVKF